MFENLMNFFKKFSKKDKNKESSNAAKERLHLVLMQDRANVSADFLELMRQEIIEVIKKYIDIDEKAIDVKLTNKMNEDGTMGAPALYANIPIVTIKNEAKKAETENQVSENENKNENESTENDVDDMKNGSNDEKESKEKTKQEDLQNTEKVIEDIKTEENIIKEDKAKESEEKIEESEHVEEKTKKEKEHTEKQSNKQKVKVNS